MNYNIKITKNTDYSPTYWSGGMASELITYPEDSSFAERNFLWRMGFAKIDIDTSTFSALPGIKRHLMVTDGQMTITHKDRYSKLLKPFMQDFFMGDWVTTTEGRCSVLNLMTREDYDGTLLNVTIPKEGQDNLNYTYPKDSSIVSICIHPLNTDIKCEVDTNSHKLEKGDLLCISITDLNILPKIKFNNSNKFNADIVCGIILKNN